ncbi:hypothetical protein PPERSA_11785 [Pseudocohnilembus persalinus]|uniref:Uncharacterized protein n=1 Tax=Pseudocohnilembus persalinus TaxID=266149 RepID=A0A0V0QR28_PSEPJ|nr:hypothetical protein PPERSA_11785 [Pseudocohnilembus persalinus]|eukprot:KRX04729.1 hypothetical protein PPERSA_11785 [Pseudocohnilembus persalinus]
MPGNSGNVRKFSGYFLEFPEIFYFDCVTGEYEYKGIIGEGYDKKKVQAEKQAAEVFLSKFIKTFTYVYKYEQLKQNQQCYNQSKQIIPEPDKIIIRDTANTKGIVDNKDKVVYYYNLDYE